MFSSNPFAALAIAPALMQGYVVIMILLVAAGTLFDIVHKGSAKYFFANWRKSRSKGAQQVGGGELVSLAVQTAVVDVLASGEFCNARRRVAHLLTMYGFVLYVVTTAVMVFGYPTPATPTPAILPQLWWLGGLMVCVGGYWFWFFIRADVAAEGNSPFRVDARGPLRPVAARQRDARPDLGLAAGAGQRRVGRALRPLHPRHHGALRRGAVVEVRAHVLQARGGVREARLQGRRDGREPANADPGRSRHSGNGTPWSCCATRRWTWGSASSAKPRATTRRQPAASGGTDQGASPCLPSST